MYTRASLPRSRKQLTRTNPELFPAANFGDGSRSQGPSAAMSDESSASNAALPPFSQMYTSKTGSAADPRSASRHSVTSSGLRYPTIMTGMGVAEIMRIREYIYGMAGSI